MSREHDVTIAGLRKPGEPADEQWYDSHGIRLVSHLRNPPLSWRTLTNSLRFRSLFAGINYSEELRCSVARLLATREYDVLHLVCSYTIPNLPLQVDVPMVVEEPNHEGLVLRQCAQLVASPLTRRLYLREARRLDDFLIEASSRSKRLVCSSAEDARAVESTTNSNLIRVVPNGVDSEYFRFRFAPKSRVPILVFVGNFNYFPNVDAVRFFANRVLPLLQAAVPGLRMRVAGYHADTKLGFLRSVPGTEVMGYRTDMRAEVAQAWVSVCPVRVASGSRIKILESMALGTPVVSTHVGATGLPVKNGLHVLLADGADMADAVLSLLTSICERERLAVAARRLVESQLTWDHSLAALRAIYSDLAGPPAIGVLDRRLPLP